MDAINAYRMHQKAMMVVDRGGRSAKCDLCGVTLGTDMHEIVNRGRTVKNEEARALSYDRRICSLLCQSCHQQAHNPEAANNLLKHNVAMYGYASVKSAFDKVVAAMSNPIGIVFPTEVECQQSELMDE